MKFFNHTAFWSPYLVGSGIGLLSIGTIFFTNNTLGASSPFVSMAAALELLLIPAYAYASTYFQTMLSQKAFFDWSFALFIGIFMGASLSSYLFQSYQSHMVPVLWQKNFGGSFIKRAFGAFVGGFLILYGARFAGGCTSGKAISGGLQLGLAAWLFIASLFITGIITAHVVYRK